MIWRWIEFILGVFGLYKKTIKDPQEQEQAQEKTEAKRKEIDRETEKEKSRTDAMPDDALNADIDKL